MRQSFESFDTFKNGILQLHEATQALKQAKYEFNNPTTFQMLFDRFRQNNRGLTFENYMELAIFLGNLRTLFTLHDTDRDGYIQVNIQEFVFLDCALFT